MELVSRGFATIDPPLSETLIKLLKKNNKQAAGESAEMPKSDARSRNEFQNFRNRINQIIIP